jgi:hypothetical protein
VNLPPEVPFFSPVDVSFPPSIHCELMPAPDLWSMIQSDAAAILTVWEILEGL